MWLSSGKSVLTEEECPSWMVPALMAVATLLVYLNSFPSVFVMDDLYIVVNNPLVRDFDLVRIFTSDYWYGVENSGLYRPLTILSFALNRMVTGSAAWGFHLVNLLLQSGVAVLLWLTLLRWEVPRFAALTAAFLFAVHPLHTEVINEVVGRSELLVALFLLLALLAARSPRRFAPGAVVATYLLALLSKEHAIVFLMILPLFDAFVAGSFRVWRQRWSLYAGLLMVTACWMVLRLYGVEHSDPRSLYSPVAVPLAYLPWGERVLSGLQYQWIYLLKMLLPYKLQAVYSLADLPQPVTSLWSLRGLLALAGAIGSIILVIAGWRHRQLWALFAACYLVSFAPTANVFIPIGVTMAERLAYLPSVWFCAAVGVFVHALRERDRLKVFVPMLLGFFLVTFSTATILRNADFASEIRLWSEEVKTTPKDYLGLLSFAEVLKASRRYEEAERAFQMVLELQPDFQGALRSYASFLVEQKRFSEALIMANRTLEVSRKQEDKAGIAHDLIDLAKIHVELGEYDKALKFLLSSEAMLLNKRDYYSLLGRAYEGQGNYPLAIEAYRQVDRHAAGQRIDFHLGLSLVKLGRLEEARLVLEEAVDSDGSAEEWNLLGTIHGQQARYREAVAAFAKAVELAPESNFYKENLQRAEQLSVAPGRNN